MGTKVHQDAAGLAGLLCLLLAMACTILLPARAHAQTEPDTLRPAVQDSIPPNAERSPDRAQNAPGQAAGSSREDAVHFTARDSLVITLNNDEGGDKSRLVGDARVAYQEMTLEAHSIDLFFESNELYARGPDGGTGTEGMPHFSEGNGNESFSGMELAYNLSTERGRVVRALTEVEEGFIRANVAKTEERTTYIQGGQYTTCECEWDETPSYTLRSERMKVVDDKWVYTGPIQLYIFNIPTPLWLPFAFLPATEGRRSGPLAPEYGEDERGFYLRNLGWYFAMNEYMDFQIRGGIWSRGSWALNPQFRYNRRDRYRGNLELDYQRLQRGEFYDPDFSLSQTARLRWNHSQTVNPFTDFNANVDLTTPLYLRTASEDYTDRVTQTATSSIRYSTRWPTAGRRLSVSMVHQENFTTGRTQLTIPSLDFTQSSFRPFERSSRPPGASERWYERIQVQRYSLSVSNRYSFDPLSEEELIERGDSAAVGIAWYEGLLSPDRYRRATGDNIPFEFSASHRLPINANFTLNRVPLLNIPMQLNLSPQISYEEDWYVSTERRHYDAEEDRAVREDVPGFFSLRQFDLSMSANTRFYGIFPMRLGAYDGLRHTVRPSFSFTYRPDFFSDTWGYTRTFVDEEGEMQRYPIVRGVPEGRQQTLSLRLGNVLETRHVTEVDTTGERQTDVIQLLNFDASTSYNFAAEQFALADINLSARTRLWDNLDLQLRSTFSPYRLDAEGERRIDQYVFSPQHFRFARLTRFSATARFSLEGSERPSGRPGTQAGTPDARDEFVDDPMMEDDITRPTGHLRADFSIPWSMNVDLSYQESRPDAHTTRRRATINTNFQFNLTPLWRIGGRTGYDVVEGEFVTSEFNIFRDLGCWEMSFRWIPFGRYQSYGFTLQVKSGHLRDLLRLQEPQRDFTGRFEQAARSRF